MALGRVKARSMTTPITMVYAEVTRGGATPDTTWRLMTSRVAKAEAEAMASRYPKMWVRPDLCEGLRDAREESTKAKSGHYDRRPHGDEQAGFFP